MQNGIQVSSFKPLMTTSEGTDHVFAQIHAMGCRVVQLQWIDFSVPVESIAASLKTHRLTSVSVQEIYDTFLERKAYYLELCRQTQSHWLCLSRIPQRFRTPEGLKLFAHELAQLTRELSAQGMALCFHPVAADYAPVEDVEPIPYLMEQLPGLALCLDFYHCNRLHMDLKALLRQYTGRVCMVHFKDSYTRPDGSPVLVPAGQGDADWTGVAEACRAAGVSYAFVEQEAWQKDPFVCLREAFDWLGTQNPEIALAQH